VQTQALDEWTAVTGNRDLFVDTETVLFDFDGPVCRLFFAHPADGIAGRFRELITAEGQAVLLTTHLRSTADFLDILRTVARQTNGSLTTLLERQLTSEELRAAARAFPTAYADRLIRTLHATGRKLAITTNNSPRAVQVYLETRGLDHLFAGQIHGRQPDARHLKPDPDCLRRALDATGTKAQHALMIGDTPSDVVAAQEAGVPFLGYARNEAKTVALHKAGARDIVDSLEEVLDVLLASRNAARTR
jgi:HAD superfamily hydrolase (TIGR01549 family)